MAESNRDQSQTELGDESAGGWLLSSALIVAVTLVSALAVSQIFSSEPSAQKSGAFKRSAMLVELRAVERGTHRPVVSAQGSVQPARDVLLRPEVAGRVVVRDADFEPGGFVKKGSRLLRIDPADYRHDLAQTQSELRKAQSELTLEKGRRQTARSEYERLMGGNLPAESEALVLRTPQFESATAGLQSAKSRVDRAQLDLQRTQIVAPFDAHVLSRDVDIGSRVAPGDTLGRLVGVEKYWVAIDLPLQKLSWVDVESRGGAGSKVALSNRNAWPVSASRSGHLSRVIGALDPTTRMARVIAVVPDPLAQGEHKGSQPLTIGEYVEVEIEGRALTEVVRLEREFLRQGDTVWLEEAGKLRIVEVEVAARDAEHVYVSKGLEDGDRVVMTNLSTVVDGAQLRVQSKGDTGEQ